MTSAAKRRRARHARKQSAIQREAVKFNRRCAFGTVIVPSSVDLSSAKEVLTTMNREVQQRFVVPAYLCGNPEAERQFIMRAHEETDLLRREVNRMTLSFAALLPYPTFLIDMLENSKNSPLSGPTIEDLVQPQFTGRNPAIVLEPKKR